MLFITLFDRDDYNFGPLMQFCLSPTAHYYFRSLYIKLQPQNSNKYPSMNIT